MIESVHELQAGMPALAGDDLDDVFDIAPGRLLAKDVQPGFETRDRHLRRDVVGQAHDQHIQFSVNKRR